MIVIRIDSPRTNSEHMDAENLIGELPWRLPSEAKLYSRIPPDLRFVDTNESVGGGGEPAIELLIALAGVSGGVITAVVTAIYQSINKFMERDANREITLEKDGKRITLKGHSLPEAKELLEMLYPEAMSQPAEPIPSLLEKSFIDAKLRLKAPDNIENT